MENGVLTSGGARFGQVLSLMLEREAGQCHGEIFFADTHPELIDDMAVPDIDVRIPYPTGSSALEQTVIRLGLENDPVVALVDEINADNREGFLNHEPFGNSFVWLLSRLHGLEQPSDLDRLIAYRRQVIDDMVDVANVVLWAYRNELSRELCQLLSKVTAEMRQRVLGRSTIQDRIEQLCARFPQWEVFSEAFPALTRRLPSPFTLTGYAYFRFLRGDEPEEVLEGTKRWQGRFADVRRAWNQVLARMKTAPLTIDDVKGLNIVFWDATHDLETPALWKTQPNLDVIVARDARWPVPRTAILTRTDLDLHEPMLNLFGLLRDKERKLWHRESRVRGPTPWLLNGSRNRYCPEASSLASSREALTSLFAEVV